MNTTEVETVVEKLVDTPQNSSKISQTIVNEPLHSLQIIPNLDSYNTRL